MLERTILLDGFSKTFAMTGWRCGFAAVPEPLVDPLTRFIVTRPRASPCSCSTPASRRYGPHGRARAMIEEFRRRRDLLVDGLNALPGVSCRRPPAPSMPSPTSPGSRPTADELAHRLLEEAGVAVLAGTAFGPGEGNLRLSYANSIENLVRAAARIGSLIERL